MKQVHDLFGDISTFLMNEELPAITTKKLLAIAIIKEAENGVSCDN